VPSLSADRAAALLAAFPCLRTLLGAPEAALAAVACGNRRLGPAAAARVFAALHYGEQGDGKEEDEDDDEEKDEEDGDGGELAS